MFRKVVFWSHLIAGVLAGLIVAMMSLTGLALTYEHQLSRGVVPVSDVGDEADQRLPLDDLLDAIQSAGVSPSNLTVFEDPRSAVMVSSANRGPTYYFDAFNGRHLGEAHTDRREFFSLMKRVHRWFALSGDSRSTGRALTATANLMFLFLIISGIYLWLPRIIRWPALRRRLVLARGVNARTRDFYWHHFFGFWALLPLLLIVLTATVFYFPTANRLVYSAFGELPPERGRSAGADMAVAAKPLSLQTLFDTAREYGEWQTLTIRVPAPGAPVQFTLDNGSGRQPQHRDQLTLDAADGSVVEWLPFAERSAGTRARYVVRFLHTGEVLGLWGQTLAGLASAFALIMVWTGMALAWRRLVEPLLPSKRR